MKHFTMEELTRSQTARTKGIDNTPSAEHRSNIEMTVAQLLDPCLLYTSPSPRD